MAHENASPLEGSSIDEESELSLGELCRHCGMRAEAVEAMVEEGILIPRGQAPRGWSFSYRSVRIVRRVVHFQRDLGVNLAGAALAMDLLDQIEALETRVRRIGG